MKTNFNFTIYLMAGILFFLFSCQEQELEHLKKNTTEAFDGNEDSSLSFGSLTDFEGLKEIFDKSSNEMDFKKNSISIKSGIDEQGQHFFQLDTSRVVSAKIGNNNYYTLPVSKNLNSNTFDNLVIGDMDSGDVTFYLMRYHYNNRIFEDLENLKITGIDKIQIKELTSREMSEFFNKSTSKNSYCYDVTSTLCDYKDEVHSAGPKCTQTYTVTRSYCIQTADWWTYTNYINTSGSGGSSGGGSDEGPNNEYIDPNDPYTQPIPTPEMYAGGLDYHLDLTSAEYNWALTNTGEAAKVMEFLDIHEFSSDSKDFAGQLITLNTNLNYDGEIKKIIASGITNTAEFVHVYYKSLATIVENNPEYLSYANYFIDRIRMAAGEVINTHPQYANWFDLTNMWLFELGNNPINFLNSDPTTENLKTQDGVIQANLKIKSAIRNNIFQISHQWQYGQDEFYTGMSEANLATSFLGTYTVKITATPLSGDSYKLSYFVTNTSTWESASRLRIDNDKNGSHDGIFPNKARNTGLHIGGNFRQNWNWEEVINLSY